MMVRINEKAKTIMEKMAVVVIIAAVAAICIVELIMIFSPNLPTLGDNGYILTETEVCGYEADSLVTVEKRAGERGEVVVYVADFACKMGVMGHRTSEGNVAVYCDDTTVCIVPEEYVLGVAGSSDETLGGILRFFADGASWIAPLCFLGAGALFLSAVPKDVFKRAPKQQETSEEDEE